MRTPHRRNFYQPVPHFLFGQFGVQAIHELYAAAYAKIVNGKHVGAVHAEHQQHFHRPFAHTFYLGEVSDYFVIVECIEVCIGKIVFLGKFRNVLDVGRFLPRQSRGP